MNSTHHSPPPRAPSSFRDPRTSTPSRSARSRAPAAAASATTLATFKTVANTTTGLTPREAQGGGAYILAAAAPPVAGQTIRITGYGNVSSPISPTWFKIQKTHTGPFSPLTSGTRLRYRVDTTGGNSGSPVVDQTNGLAIGIHTHAGCTSTGGANSGTAIEHATLQGYLSSPLGTCLPMGVNCIQTLIASNNGGGVGGAVYFDVTVASTPIEITGLQLNTGTAFGTAFDVEIYTTPGTATGVITTPGAWTSRATGGSSSGGLDAATRVTLDNSFTLSAGTSYGMAIVLTNASHRYTNGVNSYSNADLQLDLGSATNAPFTGGVFSPRTWNGTICYNLVSVSPPPWAPTASAPTPTTTSTGST